MGTRNWELGIIILLIMLCSAVGAETTWNGYIQLDERQSTSTPMSGLYSWNRARLELKAKSEISGQVIGFAELRLQTLDKPQVTQGADLSSKEKVFPMQIELREAYIDLLGYPFGKTDLRAGKQRIAWGVSDKMNPTDNLNPYDFTDLLDFGEKIPANAIKTTFYLADNTATLAFLPLFTPSVMPANYMDVLLSTIQAGLPSGTTITSFESAVNLPAAIGQNSMYGLKLSRNVGGYDVSVSYFNGYDSVPYTSQVNIIPLGLTQVACQVTQSFPKIEVWGADLAGDIRGAKVWLEAANFKPLDIPMGNYTKYTVGGDYNFIDGTYANAQFVHGFFDDRGANLTDLIFAKLEKKFFNDKMKAGLTWGGEITSRKVVGYLIGPELVFYPADATEITLASFTLDGDTGTKLGSWKDLDQAILKFKYSF
jgi:hypothetical protein